MQTKLALSFTLALSLAPHQAAAQDPIPQQLVGPAMTQGSPGVRLDEGAAVAEETVAGKGAEKGDSPEKKVEFLIVPIPISNPAIGTGVTIAAVAFYNPNKSSQPWVSGGGSAYTSTKTWGAAAFHSMSLGHDSVRVLGLVGYGDAKLKFYGIGPDAGDAGISVDLDDKAFFGLADVQVRPINHGILRHVYVGGRLLYLSLDSSIDLPHPNRPDLDLPTIELKSAISMLGPAFTFDSRDSSLNPRKGAYVTGTWLFGVKGLGSDFTHNKLQFAANGYLPLGKNTVFGIRKTLCGVSKGAPFYDLCMFGSQGDLRGYETGRYRDGASWALQGEIRQHLFGRFGAVAFAGVGGIADSTSDILKHSTVLYSGGGGIRFLASQRNKVNLRLDVAFGKDGSAVYFGIGESF